MRAYSAIIVIVLLLAALAGSLPVARAEITSTLVDSSMSDVSLGSKIFQVGSGYYAFIRDSSSGSLYYRYISGTEVGDRVLVEGNSITTSYSAATNGTHVLLIYKVDSTVNYKLGQITSPGVISWVDSFMTGSVYIYSCAFYGATPLAYLEATNDGVHFIDFTTDSIVLQYEVTTGYDAQFLVSGSNLVMAYQDYDDDTYKYVTYDGASWSTPTTIVADSYGSGANMAIDPSLTVFAYYCTYDAGAGGVAFKVYMYEGGSWVQKFKLITPS